MRWISAALGFVIDGTEGASIADSATKNNALKEYQFKGSKKAWKAYEEGLSKQNTEEQANLYDDLWKKIIAEISRDSVKGLDVNSDLYLSSIMDKYGYKVDSNGNYYNALPTYYSPYNLKLTVLQL